MGISTALSRFGARFTDLVLPRLCASCQVALGSDGLELCRECWNELMLAVGGPYCHTCGADRGPHLLIDDQCVDCRLKKPQHLRFHSFARVGKYSGALRSLILRFKRAFVLETLLGRLLADVIQERFDSSEIDVWVPIPSHWWRRLQRGFQPTALLTNQALRRCGKHAEPILTMTRYVPPFHKAMSAQRRAEAIKGAFKLVSGVSVKGRTVCIVDDVTTTGSTLAEARRTLRDAGANRIFAAVLAKTTRQ